MNQKLTLSLDSEAIDKGKGYAARVDRSLSSLVKDYFIYLGQEDSRTEAVVAPQALKSLVGIGAGPVDEEDYLRHLEEKSAR